MTAATETLSLVERVRATRQAAQMLAISSTETRNRALEAIADAIEAQAERILVANEIDLKVAAAMVEAGELSAAAYARLKLDAPKVAGMAAGIRDVMKLADPVNVTHWRRELDEGLILERRTCPLGVLGVIFESRPDAVPQISALALKTGNGVVLKGGKEATNSCQAIADAICTALEATGELPAESVCLLTTRAETQALLKLDGLVDLIVPRGSNAFVKYVQDNTSIPVLGHADGICHLYVDANADLARAVALAVDSKVQYPSACNAIETLLIHADIAAECLPPVAAAMSDRGVELRGCDRSRAIQPDLIAATDADWATEYGDLVLAVKIVADMDEAIAHIQRYGSRHTEAIATEAEDTARAFMDRVDAAGVFHKASTRFADGFRYGFGAEVGISTQQMPPRGPVGVEGLVTYKYRLTGTGQIVADYAGANAKPFLHRDL
ncbi:MAG: glutamate-5-semialdehyde dehydrogenase [Cyanobacteria bacterium P01_D01_bin.123]